MDLSSSGLLGNPWFLGLVLLLALAGAGLLLWRKPRRERSYDDPRMPGRSRDEHTSDQSFTLEKARVKLQKQAEEIRDLKRDVDKLQEDVAVLQRRVAYLQQTQPSPAAAGHPSTGPQQTHYAPLQSTTPAPQKPPQIPISTPSDAQRLAAIQSESHQILEGGRAPERKPQAEVAFAKGPEPDGTFKISNLTTEPSFESLYRITRVPGALLATVALNASHDRCQTALQAPHIYLDPVCTYTQQPPKDASTIVPLADGTAELVDGRWRMQRKLSIEFR